MYVEVTFADGSAPLQVTVTTNTEIRIIDGNAVTAGFALAGVSDVALVAGDIPAPAPVVAPDPAPAPAEPVAADPSTSTSTTGDPVVVTPVTEQDLAPVEIAQPEPEPVQPPVEETDPVAADEPVPADTPVVDPETIAGIPTDDPHTQAVFQAITTLDTALAVAGDPSNDPGGVNAHIAAAQADIDGLLTLYPESAQLLDAKSQIDGLAATLAPLPPAA